MSSLHADLNGDNMHVPWRVQWADGAARLADVNAYTSSDIGKLALQIDTNEIYVITAVDPNVFTPTVMMAAGDVTGPAGAINNAVALFDGTTGTVLKSSAVLITPTGDIVTSGLVDGQDVSSLGSQLTNHVTSTANPHNTGYNNLTAGTLAQFNTTITDATLDDASAPRTPTAHASNHQSGGSDVIAGESLDVTYTPANYTPSNGQLAGQLAGIDAAFGANVFGRDAFDVSDAVVSTTPSTTFQDKINQTLTLEGGRYRISYSYGWNHNSQATDFEARILVDSVVQGQIHKQEPKDSAGSFGTTGSDQRHIVTRVFYINLTPGTHVLQLQFRTSNAGTASSIWDAMIEGWRVS